MEKEYKIIEIEWIDSKSGGEWEYLDEIKPAIVEVKSVGYLIEEDDKSVTIAHSVAKNQCCGRITIPKVSIIRRGLG